MATIFFFVYAAPNVRKRLLCSVKNTKLPR